MRRVILAIVSTVTGLVLLLSFKTHHAPALAVAAPVRTTTTAGTTAGSGTAGSGTAGSGTTGSGTTGSGTTGSGTTTAGTKTVTGAETQTRYGPVQVQITVSNGKLTNVTATEYPTSEQRDYQINSYAIPVLNQEALTAGSASIDMVSGATYTSNGYLTSLQSALDQAGLT